MLITDVKNTTMNSFNNNTTSITCVINHDPLIDSTLNTHSLDLLIVSDIGFNSGDIIEVIKDTVSLGNFSIASDCNAIWLSELIGQTRETVDLKSGLTETYEFVFTNNQLLTFQLIGMETSLFTATAQDVYDLGLPSGYYLFTETKVNSYDENSVSAIRHAIDNTDITIAMDKNKVTIDTLFPTFGSALPISFVMDYLITFENTIPMLTEVSIKKDGLAYATKQFTKNTNYIWFSDLLGENREFLKNKISEQWELEFVYDQSVNVQVFTGEVTSFLTAEYVVNDVPFGLFELANSETLNTIPVPLSLSQFHIDYENYHNNIKEARIDIKSGQYVHIEFIKNSETDEVYCRLNNHDELFNINVDLIMDKPALREYIHLLTHIARQLK